MEAVTAILSGGLRVGVLLQGKKIRDDSKTLLQTGICHDNKLDALVFSLEPNLSQAPPPVSPEERPYLLPCDGPKPLSRYSRCSINLFGSRMYVSVCSVGFSPGIFVYLPEHHLYRLNIENDWCLSES